jgi:hypothetical protein
MNRLYEALKRAQDQNGGSASQELQESVVFPVHSTEVKHVPQQEDRSADQEPQQSVASTAQAAEVKQVPQQGTRSVNPERRESAVYPVGSADVKQIPRLSRKKRPALSDSSPLFHADADENFRLWMEEYFPNLSLTREEAIRQWLARPPEARVESFDEGPVANEQSNTSEMPVAAAQKATNGTGSSQATTGSSKHHSERTSKDRHSDRSRKFRKLRFRFATYGAGAVVIVIFLWAIPTTKVFSHADSSIVANPARTTGPGAAPSVSASQSRAETMAEPDIATQPTHIESLSIGCEEKMPCIEIDTQGKATVPTLNTLTDPDRLVVDFKDTVSSSEIRDITVGRGALKTIHVEANLRAQPPTTRVMIDLAAKCDYKLHTRTNGFFLNIFPKATP